MIHIVWIDYLNYSILYAAHAAKILIIFVGLSNNLKNFCKIYNNTRKSYFIKNCVTLLLFSFWYEVSIQDFAQNIASYFSATQQSHTTFQIVHLNKQLKNSIEFDQLIQTAKKNSKYGFNLKKNTHQ